MSQPHDNDHFLGLNVPLMTTTDQNKKSEPKQEQDEFSSYKLRCQFGPLGRPF